MGGKFVEWASAYGSRQRALTLLDRYDTYRKREVRKVVGRCVSDRSTTSASYSLTNPARSATRPSTSMEFQTTRVSGLMIAGKQQSHKGKH